MHIVNNIFDFIIKQANYIILTMTRFQACIISLKIGKEGQHGNPKVKQFAMTLEKIKGQTKDRGQSPEP